jgi:hypothetical protein
MAFKLVEKKLEENENIFLRAFAINHNSIISKNNNDF